MTDRHTADTINSDALDALYDRVERAEAELVRLHEGEEPVTNPAVMHTPAQWIWQWNRATLEQRLQVVEAAMRDGAAAHDCRLNGHRERIHDGRHAEMALNEVRALVADMEGITGARTWAGWLRDAMKRGPKHCLLCATEPKPEPAPAATEATEPAQQADAYHDDPPVQCWHTEAGTPCDWDVCNQPERLAAGDYGTDPREQRPTSEEQPGA